MLFLKRNRASYEVLFRTFIVYELIELRLTSFASSQSPFQYHQQNLRCISFNQEAIASSSDSCVMTKRLKPIDIPFFSIPAFTKYLFLLRLRFSNITTHRRRIVRSRLCCYHRSTWRRSTRNSSSLAWAEVTVSQWFPPSTRTHPLPCSPRHPISAVCTCFLDCSTPNEWNPGSLLAERSPFSEGCCFAGPGPSCVQQCPGDLWNSIISVLVAGTLKDSLASCERWFHSDEMKRGGFNYPITMVKFCERPVGMIWKGTERWRNNFRREIWLIWKKNLSRYFELKRDRVKMNKLL